MDRYVEPHSTYTTPSATHGSIPCVVGWADAAVRVTPFTLPWRTTFCRAETRRASSPEPALLKDGDMARAAVRPAAPADVDEIVRIQAATWRIAYTALVPDSAISR